MLLGIPYQKVVPRNLSAYVLLKDYKHDIQEHVGMLVWNYE